MSGVDWLHRNIDDQLINCTTVQVPEETIRRMMKVIEAAESIAGDISDANDHSQSFLNLLEAIAALQASRPEGP